MNKNRRVITAIIILACLAVVATAFIAVAVLFHNKHSGKAGEPAPADEMEIFAENTENMSVKELISTSHEAGETTEEPDKPETESQNAGNKTETDHAQEDILQPLTEKEILLSDIYTEKGKEAVFICYDKDAVSYIWEIFDLSSNKWLPAPDDAVAVSQDELYRKVSAFSVSETEDDLMVRCTLQFPDEEDTVQTASLHKLKGSIKKIIPEDYETDANNYVCVRDIPVKVVYEDNTEETIIGLNGLFFISQEEETEYSTSVSGNRVETITTTISECSYIPVGSEEKTIRMRYPAESGNIETELKVTGHDLAAPVISGLEISPFEISNIDAAVTLTVSITAEDNVTLYPYLEYAFILEGSEPGTDDWTRQSTFDVEIEKNGTYIAYVRDEAGNIAEEEREIVTVDTKPPVIQVSLSETGWCKSNQIIVKAKDYSDLNYCFTCREDNTSSDWISYDNYTVDKNGTYVIQVKDAAGNISEEEIIVSNIDKEAPVIRGINEK